MALSYASTDDVYRGKYRIIYSVATFDNSYNSGGETINATDFGLAQILAVIPNATAGYNVQYTRTNDTTGTLKIFASQTPDTNSAVAVPQDSSVGRDYSTVTAALVIIGR